MSGAVTQQNQVAPPSEQGAWIKPDGMPTEYFFRYIGQLVKELKAQGVILEDLYNQVNP
tara:strand:+ start:584 stop:760 length:177 start_codon:yes stop_codon:yes gene_type:complete